MADQATATALSPEADGFVPPWAEWDFNEWETCTADTELAVSACSVFAYSVNYWCQLGRPSLVYWLDCFPIR